MKPDGMIFDSKWRFLSEVRKCSIAEVQRFIELHYLHKRPAIVVLSLMMLYKNKPVGCILFAAPPKEANKRYGGNTWELARLYLLDYIPKNAETWFLGKAVRYVKRYHLEVDFLLSYADPSAGHNGTIYRAGNWVSDGRTDDERKSPRCDYQDPATGKIYHRKGHIPPDVQIVRVPRVSKWRYIMPLKPVATAKQIA